MLRVVVVMALAVLACTPVRADEFESFNPAPLDACIAAAANDRAALRACLGAGARPCIEAEGGVTHGYVLCWSSEADAWRARMTGASAYLANYVSYRDPQRLAAANAAWEAWAQAECEYWAYEEGGGVGEQVDRVECLAEVTAERAIDLIMAAAAP